MKALVAVALVLTPTPAFAGSGDGQAAEASPERKVCTRMRQNSASRMGYRRVCRTPTEWREAYGPDWRQEVAGTPPVDDQADALDARTRVHSTMPTTGLGSGANSGTLGPR